MTTITFSVQTPFYRGDYIIGTAVPYRLTTVLQWGTAYQVRRRLDSVIDEWCYAWLEDWILWPLADLKAKLRVRP